MEDLLDLDATALADLVHDGELSPLELVAVAISEVERTNPVLNAVVSERFDAAREDAKRIDTSLPFAGVPLLVKDNQPCTGLFTRAGSRFWRDVARDTKDHPLVSRLKSIGFIPIGKTNMPEMGLLPTTEPQLYGPCHNPFGLDRMTGGSSGGAAAAVAARLVPVATASDGGGSIRIPAAACGLVGLKPSRNRMPGSGWGGLAVTGVLTRSVRDTARILDLVSARGPENPAPLPPPPVPFATTTGDGNPGPLRVGMCKGFGFGSDCEASVWDATLDTARVMSELGHSVDEIEIDLPAGPYGEVADDVNYIVPAAMARQVEVWEAVRGSGGQEKEFEPLTWQFIEYGRPITARQLLSSYEALELLARVTAELFETYDLLLTPTVNQPAPPIGSWRFPANEPFSGWASVDKFMPPYLTQLANFLGHPAISLPLHTGEAGLPIGSQLYGRFGDEALVLQVASSLEGALPWVERKPQL